MGLKLAIIFSVLAIGGIVVSWATDWYRITSIELANASTRANFKTQFYWTYAKTSNSDSDSQHYYKDDPKLPNIARTFDTCLTFLTVGAAVLMTVTIWNSDDYTQYNCDKLLGKSTDGNVLFLGGTYSWTPGPGWWLLLGAVVLSVFSLMQTLKAPKSI